MPAPDKTEKQSRQSRPDIGSHLADSLETSGRAWRKRLKQCCRHLSEGSVHELRIETRRLLALLNSLRALLGKDAIKPPRKYLTELFHRFSKLRDTHVLLLSVKESMTEFPSLKEFRSSLTKREQKVGKRLGKALAELHAGHLTKLLGSTRKALKTALAKTDAGTLRRVFSKAAHDAFAVVSTVARGCKANDIATIHAMRIAFKEFRYLVEMLHPALPLVTAGHLEAMHAFQTRMGEIQDDDIMLEALDAFKRKKPKSAAIIHPFRAEILRRRATVVRSVLENRRRLAAFRPSHGR